MPCTPTAISASRTSSSLNGLMMAMTSFMDRPVRRVAARSAPHDIGSAERKLSGIGNRWATSFTVGKPVSSAAIVCDLQATGCRSRSSPSWATEATSVPSRAKMSPREKPREPAQVGAVLRIEQPFVGAERTVKPERVVEARRHDGLFEHGAAVRDQRRIEQHHVGRIGEHALMDRGLVRQLRRWRGSRRGSGRPRSFLPR